MTLEELIAKCRESDGDADVALELGRLADAIERRTLELATEEIADAAACKILAEQKGE